MKTWTISTATNWLLKNGCESTAYPNVLAIKKNTSLGLTACSAYDFLKNKGYSILKNH